MVPHGGVSAFARKLVGERRRLSGASEVVFAPGQDGAELTVLPGDNQFGVVRNRSVFRIAFTEPEVLCPQVGVAELLRDRRMRVIEQFLIDH